MMMCTRCQKNVAVVFITKLENGKTINEGLCLKCAKDMGLPAVDAQYAGCGKFKRGRNGKHDKSAC